MQSDIKNANFRSVDQAVAVVKFSFYHDIAATARITCHVIVHISSNLNALAGIICPSGAASIIFCHVFVESGMTKPNWKCHSEAVKWHATARLQFTFNTISVENNALLEAEILQRIFRPKFDLTCNSATFQNLFGDTCCGMSDRTHSPRLAACTTHHTHSNQPPTSK